jgi:hypothetical protein
LPECGQRSRAGVTFHDKQGMAFGSTLIIEESHALGIDPLAPPV